MSSFLLHTLGIMFFETTCLLSSGSLSTTIMSSDSLPGLTDEEFVYGLAYVFHASILDILGYGIYTTIYFVAVYLILSRTTERPRVGSVVLVTSMWILVTIHASIRWAKTDNIYIRHGETWETKLKSLIFARFVDFFLPSVVDAAVTFISLLLADVTMIWRCWVLYGRQWLAIMIPGLSLVAGSVCYVWQSILLYKPLGVWQTNQFTNLGLVFLSTTVLTNIFCTSAIVYRLITVSGWRKALKTYHRIVEILIESSILYTTIYVIRIGLQIYTQYFTEELDERLFFPQALGNSITGIAPTLITARVAAGFARPDDTWTRTSLPHMGSTMRSLAESLHFAQPATGTVDNVDLEQSIMSDASVAMGEGDETHYKSPKQSASGARNDLGKVSKEV